MLWGWAAGVLGAGAIATEAEASSHHYVISVLQLSQRGTRKSLGLSRKGQQRNPEEGPGYTCGHSKTGGKSRHGNI